MKPSGSSSSPTGVCKNQIRCLIWDRHRHLIRGGVVSVAAIDTISYPRFISFLILSRHLSCRGSMVLALMSAYEMVLALSTKYT